MTVDSIHDGVFVHDEADITIISYMLQSADDGCHVVRVLSDDMDIFVLLVFWTWRCNLKERIAVQMEKWDDVVLDVNATCVNLGAPFAHSCLEHMQPPAVTPYPTLSAMVRLQCQRH